MRSQQVFKFEKSLNTSNAKNKFGEHSFPDLLNYVLYIATKICKLLQIIIIMKCPVFEELWNIIEQKYKIEKQIAFTAGTQHVFQERWQKYVDFTKVST